MDFCKTGIHFFLPISSVSPWHYFFATEAQRHRGRNYLFITIFKLMEIQTAITGTARYNILDISVDSNA